MRHISGLFMLLLACGVPSQTNAGLVKRMSVEDLSSAADVIVHGTVKTRTVQRDAEGRIYTSVELQIDETWKGKLKPDTFRIVHAGGVLGDEVAEASIQVHYEIGEEVVAYLRLNERGEGVTLGLVQGKFTVRRDPDTAEKTASNLFYGKRPPAHGQSAPAAKLTLTELKRRSTGSRP